MRESRERFKLPILQRCVTESNCRHVLMLDSTSLARRGFAMCVRWHAMAAAIRTDLKALIMLYCGMQRGHQGSPDEVQIEVLPSNFSVR